MGDKDNPFESIFGGRGEPILIPESSIEDYEAMIRFMKGDRLITPDREDLPIQTFRPLKDKIPSFNFDIPKEDMESFKRMLEEPIFKENDNLIGRLRQEVEKSKLYRLIIEGEPTINKPKNLKYPHKKRKRRILKKWAKRFGVTPNQLVFPEVEVGVTPDENGLFFYHISAKPKKQL